ncbi:hypothetical protein M0R04_03525 [Candidatus Dojkabacteria bacterium]|nr:hypothetical protein [Candidatus Dojkabacteria bacterium]
MLPNTFEVEVTEEEKPIPPTAYEELMGILSEKIIIAARTRNRGRQPEWKTDETNLLITDLNNNHKAINALLGYPTKELS